MLSTQPQPRCEVSGCRYPAKYLLAHTTRIDVEPRDYVWVGVCGMHAVDWWKDVPEEAIPTYQWAYLIRAAYTEGTQVYPVPKEG